MSARNAQIFLAEALQISNSLHEPLDVENVLDKVCDFAGGKYAVYHVARGNWDLADCPVVKTNYPAPWVQRYLTRNYVSVDPVVERGFTSALPFYWDELKLGSSAEKAFFKDAMSHGLGRSGLSIPIADKLKRRALFSMSSDAKPGDWRNLTESKLPILMDIAHYLHQNMHLTGRPSSWDIPRLSPREIECLSWIAKGKDTCAIALILGLSEHTVRDYLKSARYKLGCSTLAHAVHKATLARLLLQYENQSP